MKLVPVFVPDQMVTVRTGAKVLFGTGSHIQDQHAH